MHLLGRTKYSVEAWPFECRRGVGHYEGGKAEITRHTGRSRNAVVRSQANDDKGANIHREQIGAELRSDKSAVDHLAIDALVIARSRLWLCFVTRGAAPQPATSVL